MYVYLTVSQHIKVSHGQLSNECIDINTCTHYIEIHNTLAQTAIFKKIVFFSRQFI